jgi:hypothetical protein
VKRDISPFTLHVLRFRPSNCSNSITLGTPLGCFRHFPSDTDIWFKLREAVEATASLLQKEEERARDGGIPGKTYENIMAMASNPEQREV